MPLLSSAREKVELENGFIHQLAWSFRSSFFFFYHDTSFIHSFRNSLNPLMDESLTYPPGPFLDRKLLLKRDGIECINGALKMIKYSFIPVVPIESFFLRARD